MRLSWRTELIPLSILGAMFVAAALSWQHVPERMPIHWNLQGQPDGYGGKFVGLLLLPLIALGVYPALSFLPRLDPGYRNYQNFATAYHVIRISVLMLLGAVYGVTLLAALGYQVDMTTVVCALVGAMLIVFGNFMGKIRPNWFVGVRTPWTLSSKLSWDKTHRLAGWLFIAIGILMFALAIVPTQWMLVATITLAGAMVVWLVVYSYLVYRNDPARVPPAGTSPSGE